MVSESSTYMRKIYLELRGAIKELLNVLDKNTEELLIIEFTIRSGISKKKISDMLDDYYRVGVYQRVTDRRKYLEENNIIPKQAVEVEDKDMEAVSGLLTATVEEKKKEKEEG